MFDDRVFEHPVPAPETAGPQDRPVPPLPHEEPHGHPVPPPPPPPLHHDPHGPGGPHHPAPPPPPPPGHHAPPPPPPHHGPHGPHIDPERYEKLDTDGKLMALILALGHAGRFHFDERGGQRRALGLLPAEGPMTQRELTERLGIQPGSASELVGKLERAGLITRTPSETDRRTADIRLTEAGLARRQEQEKEQGSKKQFFHSPIVPFNLTVNLTYYLESSSLKTANLPEK